MSEHVLALIEQHFTTGLPAARDAQMRAHVRECEACERLYERYASAEAAFSPPGDGLGVAATARLEAALFDLPPAPPPRRNLGWVAGLLAAGAALSALFLVRPASGPVDGSPGRLPEAFTPRSGAAPADSGAVSLRVLRLRTDASGVAVTDLSTKGATLRPGDEIAILYVNHERAERARVVLRTPDGRARILVPSRDIDAEVEDAKLGAPIRVDAAWPKGRGRIEATFFGPLDAEWVRAVEVERVDP